MVLWQIATTNRRDILEIHFIDYDSFITSFKPNKLLIERLKSFEKEFDFCDLVSSQKLYSEDTKVVVGTMKT